jgi:phospholipid-binding lipoprotein MlaA
LRLRTDYYKMASKETGTLTESKEMKLQAWYIVILTVLIAGCASSNNNAKFSTNQQNTLNNPNNIESDPNSLDEAFADEEFDLLEEELDEQVVEVADPLEPWNRLMFGVNDVLYFWVVKPVVGTYKAVVPEPARTGVRNFFHNLTTPVRYVNCLLQGKGDSADTELRRFLVNTTEGILGFGDPARDKYELEPVQEDLGQTLAVHGMDQGFYIVWPFFGPSNVRDSLGMVGDMFLNPVRYVEPTETSIYISAGKGINEGSFHIGEYEEFKAAALEPYIAMREAYIQYRNKKIQE